MADESYWTYKAASPTPATPPEGSKMSLRDWHSLSPGMRREITRQAAKPPLVYPKEIEVQTAELWLSAGTIRVDSTGSENTYYLDQFDNRFFCKNYPR